VLVYHDMEGLAGEGDWRLFLFSHPEEYARGREMLVADVNAVVAGLFEGGASVVDVVDAHGSGNPDPDIPEEKLDRRAHMVFRDEPFDPYVDIIEPGKYDAVAVVGMHAKTGSRGFAAHTITLGMDVLMGGRGVTETEIVAYSWGRVGVPVVFASGDDRLREDLRTMPWIEYVTTKKATSASTVELRPVDEVHAEMRAGAARALRELPRMKAMKLPEPVRAALHAVPPASLAMLQGVPGIDYAPDTVRFTAPTFRAAYDGITALVRVARGGYPSLWGETLADVPGGADLRQKYSDALFLRWMDAESGRWKAAPPRPRPAGRKYHGDN
jgi:D-amino peptidase